MNKKGKIVMNWKRRYFELFQDGKLLYYTDESKQTRKGIADLSVIIGFNVVDNKSFEVITPDRIWCFQCKFKSECEYWIESMKGIELSYLHHDADNPNERDYLNLSANESVLKLIAKMGPPDGEQILYSDRIRISLLNHSKQRQDTTVLMLTTVAIYHLRPNLANLYKKCQRRIPLHSIACCTIRNAEELCIADVLYKTETKNMRVILRTLCKADVEVLFQREEDEVIFSLFHPLYSSVLLSFLCRPFKPCST